MPFAIFQYYSKMPVPQTTTTLAQASRNLRLRQAAALRNLSQTGGSLGKAVKIGPIRKGALMGYHLDLPAAHRRAILGAVIRKDGWTTVSRRLTALKTFFKHLPGNRTIVDNDLRWMRKVHV